MSLEPIRFDGVSPVGAGRNGVLGLFSTLLLGGSRIVTNVVLGRLGGPELLGLVQNVLSTATLATLFLPTSAGSAASKYVAFYRAKEDVESAKAVTKFIGARTFQATVVLLVIVTAIGLYVGPADPAIAWVTGLLVVSMCSQTFIRGVHYGTGQVSRLVKWDVLASLGSLATVVVLVLAGVRNVWVLVPLAAITLIFVLVSWPRGRVPIVRESVRREIDRFMLLGIVGTVSSSGFLQSSILVATATNGLHYSGQYAAALTLTTPVTLIASAIALALFPAMAGDYGRSDLLALNRRTNNATRILITVMIAMFGSISILAEPLTMLVWGREFENTSQILILLLLAVVLITVAVPSVNSLTTQSNRGMAVSAFSSLLGFTVGASTWVWLGGTAPGYSVPAGYLLGAMIISGVPYVLVWRSQRQHWSVQTMVLLGALASVLTITFSVRAADLPDWGLLIAAVLFLVVWCAVRSRDVKQIARLLVDLLDRRGA